MLARAFLQELVDPGSGRRIVQAKQVRLVRDLPVQHVIGMQLEVEELARVSPVGTAPPVVVHSGWEVGSGEEPARFLGRGRLGYGFHAWQPRRR